MLKIKKRLKLYQEYGSFNVYKVYLVKIVYDKNDILKENPKEKLIYLYTTCKYKPPYNAHLGGGHLNVEE